MTEVTSVVKAVKEELPNTKKRLEKQTYRHIMLTNQLSEQFTVVQRPKSKHDPFTLNANIVTQKLQNPRTQKVLCDLRQNAFIQEPEKIKRLLVKKQTGLIKPKCEVLDTQEEVQKELFDLQRKEMSEPEMQEQLESQKSWLR
jgi:hypothetical protein